VKKLINRSPGGESGGAFDGGPSEREKRGARPRGSLEGREESPAAAKMILSALEKMGGRGCVLGDWDRSLKRTSRKREEGG